MLTLSAPEKAPQQQFLPNSFHRDMERSRTAIRDSRSRMDRFASPGLLTADMLVWLAAFYATSSLLPHSTSAFSSFWIGTAVGMLALYLVGGYDRRSDFLSLSYTSEHVIAFLAAASVTMFIVYGVSAFNDVVKPSRAFIPLYFFIVSIPCLYFRRWLGFHLRRHHSAGSLLVLGSGPRATRFYEEYLKSDLLWKLEFADFKGSDSLRRIAGLGSPIVEANADEKLAMVDARYAAIVLACDVRHLPPRVLEGLVALHCSHVPVLTLESFHEEHWRRVSIEAIGPEWLFDSEFRLAQGSVFSHVKRLFDLAFAVCALLLTAPFIAIAALAVRLESPGPAIFRQERVGRDGKIFNIYKLRTMRQNDGDMYTRPGDSRITRLGYWLRVTRMDELPQLWNVLMGDMSLIGPRAEWVRCAEIYEREIPNYHLRHLVTPGITGWAQVKFKYGESKSDTIEKFQFDLYYIRHFSLQLDVSILLKTIHTIVCAKGR